MLWANQSKSIVFPGEEIVYLETVKISLAFVERAMTDFDPYALQAWINDFPSQIEFLFTAIDFFGSFSVSFFLNKFIINTYFCGSIQNENLFDITRKSDLFVKSVKYVPSFPFAFYYTTQSNFLKMYDVCSRIIFCTTPRVLYFWKHHKSRKQ